MQPDDKNTLVKNWLIKAEEALSDADIAIKNEILSAAQNRIYYAIFYSVMALGYYRDFVTSSHEKLSGWFNKNFMKDGIFDRKLGKTYKIAYENKTKSDYAYTYKPDKDKINNLFNDAKIFIKTIQDYIKE